MEDTSGAADGDAQGNIRGQGAIRNTVSLPSWSSGPVRLHKQASEQANKQASKQASKQGGKQESKQASKLANMTVILHTHHAGIHIQPILVGNRAPLQCIVLKETPLLPSGSV